MIVIGPPFSDKRFLSVLQTIAVAVAIMMEVLMTPPALRTALMYFMTAVSSSSPSSKGLPYLLTGRLFIRTLPCSLLSLSLMTCLSSAEYFFFLVLTELSLISFTK